VQGAQRGAAAQHLLHIGAAAGCTCSSWCQAAAVAGCGSAGGVGRLQGGGGVQAAGTGSRGQRPVEMLLFVLHVAAALSGVDCEVLGGTPDRRGAR
jgi:hypothetical protein